MRLDMSLPDGYRVREVEGRLHLFDPQGILLPGPKDPSLIEAYAWRHAWRHIARELNEELADVHAGDRSLHSCRRLRQYMRMLDAVRQPSSEVEERPARRPIVAWGVLAASAAVIAAVFLTAPLRTTRAPESPPPAASDQPGITAVAKREAPASPAGPRASAPERVAPTTRAAGQSGGSTRAVSPRTRGAALGEYAVSFGTFVDRATADTMMHFIRSKGYIVYVARIGEEFSVVTRPYRTRAQAERLASALREIRLPAQLAPSRAI